MGSSRLPGKVLEPLCGQPLISRLVDRVERSNRIDHLVVATSVNPLDDRLADHLASRGVAVRRGPEHDVLSRFTAVMDEFNPDVVIRLTGDNPLVDGCLVDQVIVHHEKAGAHYTTNGRSGTFPHGSNVEVIDAAALRDLASRNVDDDEREHVTLGLLRRPDAYSLSSLSRDPSHGHLRWTVDTPEDLAWVKSVFEALVPESGDYFEYDDVVRWIEADPRRVRLNTGA